MYKQGDVVVLGVHRFKEDNLVMIGIVQEIEFSEDIRMKTVWVHPDHKDTLVRKYYKLTGANLDYIRHLDDEKVRENGRELFKVLFEGKKR